jgi:hypothetical protein
MKVTTSACVHSTRDQGGLRAALTGIVDAWFEEEASSIESPDLWEFPSFVDDTRFTETGEQNRRGHPRPLRGSVEYVCNILENPDDERKRIARILRDASLRWARQRIHYRHGRDPDWDPPEAEVLAVEERGFKARVVTKSPPQLVELGHLVRGLVWPMLESDPRVRVSLEGKRLEALFENLSDHPIQVPLELGDLALVSADLSAATDSFAAWSIEAVWEGVCDGVGFDSDIRLIGRMLLGPMEVRYPEDSGIGSFTSQAGCLMGLPLSWFVLNLINLWACEDAVRQSMAEHRVPGFAGERLLRLAVCGDDLAAIMARSAHRLYRDNLESVGSGFSAGKHLVSRDLLLFTEQVAEFIQAERPAPAWTAAGSAGIPLTYLYPYRMCDVMPVRALVHPGHFAVKKVSGPVRFEQPSWSTAGPAISSSIPDWASPRLRRRVAVACRFLRPERKRLLEAGIAVELPREVGGGGFPPFNPDRSFRDAPRIWRRFVLSAFIFGGKSIRKARQLWLVSGVAGDTLEEALAIAEERLPHLIIDDMTDMFTHPRDCAQVSMSGGGLCLTESDAELRVAATWAPALSVGSFFEPRRYATKFWKFNQQLRRLILSESHRVTGRGGKLSGRTDSEILESVRDLADGRVLLLDSNDVPPSLSVELGTRLGNPGRWASPQKRPIRSYRRR